MKVWEGSWTFEESTFCELFKKMFQQCTRLSYDTFCALVRVVGPSFEWKNTNMRENMLIRARV